VRTCTLIRDNDDRFLSPSSHKRACSDLCTRDEGDITLYAAGAQVDSVRFCADECAPKTDGLCAAGHPDAGDGNGRPLSVVQPVVFHATKKEQLPAAEWPSVINNAHDVGFRAEELRAEVVSRRDVAKHASEIAESVHSSTVTALPKAMNFATQGQEQAVAATDALRASRGMMDELYEAADQSAHSVMARTVKDVVKAAHDTAEVKAKEEAAKLEKEMKAKIPAAKKAAMKPYVEAMGRAAAVAGDYVKAGDGLGGLSLGDQLTATQQLGSASQFMALGEVGKGQSYMRDATALMGQAKGEASASQGMYDTAGKITSTLGGYMNQAAAAAYSAEVMLNPDAPPPPPPII